jgi:hypothetical protein
MILDALSIFVLLIAWGAQAIVPWRLAKKAADHAPALDGAPVASPEPPAAAEPPPRADLLWRLAGFPLATAGLMAAFLVADRNPDAAIAARLVPLLGSTPGRLLALLAPALVGVALVGSLAGPRLEAAGRRLGAALALAACAAASWAGELLRAGEGPASPAPALALLVACRLALTLAAGELIAPGRPRWAAAGGLALLAYLPLLPPELGAALWSRGLALTCGMAALLLLAARWLPRPLRRPALAAGVLLAALVLAQAGRVSQALAPALAPTEIPE